MTSYRPAGSENVGVGEAAQSTCLEIDQRRHYLTILLDVQMAMGLFANRALNRIRISLYLVNNLQFIEALTVKLQQLVTKRPAVIRPAVV